MATIETGSIVSDIRGSIGGETYSRNPGGLYVKARSSPAQPASAYRDTVQAALTALTQAWSGTLTESQRTGWRQYAKTWPDHNRLGQVIQHTGFNHFVRCNFYFYVAYSSIQFSNPPEAGPAHLPQFTFTANSGTNQVTIALPMVSYPTPPVWQFLFLYIGKEVNTGRNYYSTPWRWRSHNYWNGTIWTHDPWVVSTPWNITSGKKLFCKMATVLEHGETSKLFQTDVIIT